MLTVTAVGADVGRARARAYAAVDAAYKAPFRESLRTRILRDFTWTRAAEETFRAYKEAL